MFCNKCGNRLNPDSLFCGACGARVEQQPAPTPDYDATVCAAFVAQPAQPPMEQPMQPLNRQPMEELNRQPMEELNRQPMEELNRQPMYQEPVQTAQSEWSYQSPTQMQYDYAQPQYEYMPPQEQPQPWSYVPEQPKKVKKPINKGKLFASLAASVVAVATISVALLYLFVFSTPGYKLNSALDTTGEELRALIGEDTNVVQLVDEVREIEDEMHLELDISGHSVIFDYSRDDKIFSAEADIMGYSGQIVADEEKLAASIPALLDQAYSIPLKNFGKELCDWELLEGEIPNDVRGQLEGVSINLFADTTWDAFCDTDAYDKFIDSLVIEEVDRSVPNSSAETVYRVHVEVKDIVEVYYAYIEFCMKPILGEELMELYMGASYDVLAEEMAEEMEGLSVDLYVGMNDDDCIVAVLASAIEYDEVVSEIAILLNGEDNPWERIELYEDGYLVGTLTIETNSDGFALYADDYCVLKADEDSIVISPEEYDSFVIYYEVTDEGCEFSCFIEEVPVSVILSDECKAKKIGKNTVNVFDMDMYDLEELAEELETLFD